MPIVLEGTVFIGETQDGMRVFAIDVDGTPYHVRMTKEVAERVGRQLQGHGLWTPPAGTRVEVDGDGT